MPSSSHRHVLALAGRLDRALAESLSISRRDARELLRLGRVRVNGRRAGEGDRGRTLEAGCVLEIDGGPESLGQIHPDPSSPVTILADGMGWIALDKPAGIGAHPLRSDQTDTLLNRLVAIRPHVVGVGEGGLRSGVVHRLDVDTTGVQLFALEQSTWTRLRAAFSQHRVDKVYRAVLEGHLARDGEIELDLAITRHRPARVEVSGPDRHGSAVRRCGLRWRVLEHLDRSTLVEVRPRTGFLHQVRVSFAHLGHPLVGDVVYGGTDREARADRHLLHASRLVYEEIVAASEDPTDMRTWIERGGTA